jgi:Malic enzyme, NAD binding domain
MRANIAQTAQVFPGIGLGAIMSRTTRIRDEMVIAAAQVRSWISYACCAAGLSTLELQLCCPVSYMPSCTGVHNPAEWKAELCSHIWGPI